MIFLLPLIADAYCQKRIEALEELGVETEIFGYERICYPGKASPTRYKSLGSLQHGCYYKRLMPLIRAFFKVRNAFTKADVIYSFGLYMLLLGWLSSLFKNKPLHLVYEVADIRMALLGNSPKSRFLRLIERFLLRRISLLVVTSRAYATEYYQEIQGIRNIRYHLIENKLCAFGLPIVNEIDYKKFNGTLSIGYFGLIRCERSLIILRELAERGDGRININIRGYPGNLEHTVSNLEHILNRMQHISHIDYGGPYKSPDDLKDIYKYIDMVWACYPYHQGDVGNHRWARTNRFYEACFFQKPIIADVNTEDGKVVNNLKIGKCIDLSDIEGTVNQILDIRAEDILEWQNNLNKLPQNICLYTDEHEKLLEKLNIASKRTPKL